MDLMAGGDTKVVGKRVWENNDCGLVVVVLRGEGGGGGVVYLLLFNFSSLRFSLI